MNLWIIAAITIGLLVVAGIIIVNTDMVTAEAPEKVSCSNCGNSCTGDSNCGLGTCGAVKGTGSCGCRK